MTLTATYIDDYGNYLGPAAGITITFDTSPDLQITGTNPATSQPHVGISDGNGNVVIYLKALQPSSAIYGSYVHAFGDFPAGYQDQNATVVGTIISATSVSVDNPAVTSGDTITFTAHTTPTGFEDYISFTFIREGSLSIHFDVIFFGGGVATLKIYTPGKYFMDVYTCPEDPGASVPFTIKPTSVDVTPNPSTVGFEKQQQYSAISMDSLGGSVNDLAITWSLVPTQLGSIDSNGLFTAASQAALEAAGLLVDGKATGKVAAEVLGVKGEAEVVVKEMAVLCCHYLS